MASQKLITVFGATGNQGGSVIDTVLASPSLQSKYTLRGITRDPSSTKAQALASKGVEMATGDLDDPASLKAAVKGSYGVFGVTDFWAHLDKAREIQQGKNIFLACREEGVEHFVFSTLPWAAKLTEGVLKHVDHFDSKAEVAEFVEAEKGKGMVASFVMPAMFMDTLSASVQVRDGQAALSMPYPSENIAWPLIQPRRDVGKYVMGLFEAGAAADGAKVHAVSTWTTPKDVVAAISKNANRSVAFNPIPAAAFQGILAKIRGEVVAEELTETMRLVGEYSYYGKGQEAKQAEHDRWLLPGSEKTSYEMWAEMTGPFKYE